MKEYTSCFIGIPLPSRFQNDYEDLLNQVSAISTEIVMAHPKTPHITVCYLDKQSQFNIQEIEKIIKGYLELIKGVKIKVGGLGYFRDNDPKVIFLNVESPKEVEEFSNVVSKALSTYSATENNLPFHPHMTVARLENPKAKEEFRDNNSDLVSLLDKEWEFELEELGIYGVDSNKHPQFQEKLISIEI